MSYDLDWKSHLRDGGLRGCSHWFFHHDSEYRRRSECGPDGKPEFVPGARVMWAG